MGSIVDKSATHEHTPTSSEDILDQAGTIIAGGNPGAIPEPPLHDLTLKASHSWPHRILNYLKEQWFVIALGLVILIASQVQVALDHQEIKETVVSYTCVSVIFLLTGLTLPTKALIQNYGRWKMHLFVQVQCFLLTSSVIFGVVSACASNADFMDPGLLVGLILLGCVPTTLSSNVVMTRQSNGNTAMTVVQSTVGNFLGPFLTPALLTMYLSSGAEYTKVLPHESGGYGEIYRRVFKQLGLSIFVPMFVGQVIRNLFTKQVDRIFSKYKLNKIASLALLIVIWSAYDQAFASHAFSTLKASNIIFIVFISIALFIVFLATCFSLSLLWLDKKDTISVCYCVPAKTPAIGVPLSQVLWVGLSVELSSKVQIPMVIYQGLQIVAGSLLTSAFRAWVGDEGLVVRNDEEKGQPRSGDLDTAKPIRSDSPKAENNSI